MKGDKMISMIKRAMVISLCIILTMAFATGCGSEAKKEMKSTIEAANQILEKDEKPYDAKTKEALKTAIENADSASDDEGYKAATEEISKAEKAYQDSIKQLKQVTNPTEEFLIERAKTVDTITKVEAATEETDGNKMMNKPGGYTSYIAMRSSLVKNEFYASQTPVEAGTDGGAVIEAFKTVKDAEARNTYLAGLDGAGALAPGSHKVVGTLLVRTSNELTATQQKNLEKSIIDALIKLDE